MKRHPVGHLGRGATHRMLAIACCSAGAHARVSATPATPIALAAAPPPATPPAPAAAPPHPPLFLAHRLNRAPPLLVPDRPQPPNRCNSCVDSLLDGFLVLTNASGTFLAALLALRQHDNELHAAVTPPSSPRRLGRSSSSSPPRTRSTIRPTPLELPHPGQGPPPRGLDATHRYARRRSRPRPAPRCSPPRPACLRCRI